MKIATWNINGYRSVTGQNTNAKRSPAKENFLFDFISQFSPDIVCLQETKAKQEQIVDELQFPIGYNGTYHSAERKGYSGVATFSKSAISIEHKNDFGIEEFDAEGRVIISELSDFILLNVYFPNGQRDEERLQYKLRFYEKLFLFIEELRKSHPHILICGDFNTAHKPIDLAHPKQNENRSGFLPVERDLLDKIIDMGYVDVFREFDLGPDRYTWWSNITKARERNIGWRIDYFFGTKEVLPRVKNCWIEPNVFGSDHCPVFIELD